MQILNGAVAALLLLTITFAGAADAAGRASCVDAAVVTSDASLRADGSVDARAFIKPEAAPRALAERSQEAPSLMQGSSASEQRGSGPFSPLSLLFKEPAPSSASSRRAHLQVYRL